jgi:hypothetical protein
MRKKFEPKEKTIVVRLTQREYDQIQDFIKLIGVDTSTLIRNSTSSFIEEFCRDNQEESWRPIIPKIIPNSPFLEDFTNNIEYERSITSSNKGEDFFKNSSIPNEYLIQYVGSRFTLGVNDKFKLESFIFDELGFPQNHKINWNSPLVGLLVMYSKYKLPS